MTTFSKSVAVALACAVAVAVGTSAHAQAERTISSTRCGDGLEAFGPPNEFGYPSWYADQNLLALDHCGNSDVADPLCGAPLAELPMPNDPPSVATGNFWAEQFYFLGLANAPNPVGESLLVLAVEGVWDNATEAIIDGDQLVFSRIRIRVDLPTNSTPGLYTVTHPYGVDTFNVTAADLAATAVPGGVSRRAINFTDDCLHTVNAQGVIQPTCAVATGDQFTNPLDILTDGTIARISHWLRWDPAQSPAPTGYIGHPLQPHTVIGSSCGTNFYRVQGPAFPTGATTTDFTLMGRIRPVCGDGNVDTAIGEQCDDRNTLDGDCCSSTCQFTDGNACNDGNPCTAGDVCSAGACVGTTPTTPPPCPVGSVTADVTVASDSANTALGGKTKLTVDASPIKRTFVRVNVSGLGTQPLSSAKLRLRTLNASGADSSVGGSIHPITSCAWNEATMTFNSGQPSINGPTLFTAGAVGKNQIVDFPITSAITGDGNFCFALDSPSSNNADYNSREATTAANRPQLLLTGSCACAVPTCGDGVINQTSEQCDGTATGTCTFGCRTNCTCAPAPTCGDGIVNQTSEQCDGSANATCTFGCQANCTCAPPAPPSATVTADVAALSGSPNSNFGTASTFEVDIDRPSETFLRIQVTGVGTQTVTSARLRLRVTGASNSGGTIRRLPAADCTWGETTLTWNNRPLTTQTALSSLGAVSSGQTVEFDITGGIPGDGTFCFKMDSASTDGADYASRENSTVAARPQVILVTSP